MGLKMQVDMRMLALLLRKEYSAHPVVIGVRETLQNAVDACKNSGRKPEISIEIQKDDSGVWVICKDNGIGMTPQVIDDYFLTIGNPHKEGQESQTGRFGIGIKVAINSVNEWWVKTNQYEFDNSFLVAGKDLAISKNPIVGTEIGIFAAESLPWYALDRALSMIYYSDVGIKLTVTVDGKVVVNDPHAGFGTQVMKTDYEDDEFKCSLTGSKERSVLSYDERIGRNVMRINGLVQFMAYSNGRATNLLFDFKKTDKDYPFTPSRETLTGSLGQDVANIIERHTIDSVTSARTLKNPDPVLKRVAGFSIRGARGRVREVVSTLQELVEDMQVHLEGSNIARVTLSNGVSGTVAEGVIRNGQFERLIQILYSQNGIDVPAEVPQSKTPKLLLADYNPSSSSQRKHDVKLLELWKELLIMVCDRDDEFGIGLSSNPAGPDASRTMHDSEAYYVLNPKSVQAVGSKEGKVLCLWNMACHEAAHHLHSSHNEQFSSYHARIIKETSDVMGREINRLKRLI